MRGLTTLLVPMLLLAPAAHADNSGLQRCRGLTDPAARLSCYDALVPAPAPLPTSGAPAPAPATAPALAATSTPVPASKPEVQSDRFGLATPAAETAQAVDSHIPGEFRGWESNSRIKLANGQVWEVVDGSRGALAPVVDQKVRVRRGVLGSFYLEIEGLNRSPRVKRVE